MVFGLNMRKGTAVCVMLSPLYMELTERLKACFRRDESSDNIMKHVADCIQDFGRSGVIEVLTKMVENEDVLSLVAKRSYFQGNGFYKIVLTENESFSLRLHIWVPNTLAQENLHSHCWPLASTVISGKLEGEIWENSATAETPLYNEYLYVGKNKELLSMGKARVKLANKVLYTEGEAYTLSPDSLHRILYSGEKVTATLMCRPAACRQWSRNIAVNGRKPSVKPTYMSIDELLKLINFYLPNCES